VSKRLVEERNGRWIEAVEEDPKKTQGIRNWKREALGKFEGAICRRPRPDIGLLRRKRRRRQRRLLS
jgi:hypothetical protein